MFKEEVQVQEIKVTLKNEETLTSVAFKFCSTVQFDCLFQKKIHFKKKKKVKKSGEMK